MVMIVAVILVFTVLLLEFRTFLEPLCIVIGALCISVLLSLVATPALYALLKRLSGSGR